MQNFVLILSLSVLSAGSLFATTSAAFAQEATSAATAGEMLFAADGKRLAAVYKVASDGSPQIILNGKLVTVPATTVSEDNGKLMTSLTRKELAMIR